MLYYNHKQKVFYIAEVMSNRQFDIFDGYKGEKMNIKLYFKKITAIMLMLMLVLSCAACEDTKQTSTPADDSESREAAYKAVVQSTVNRYGILDEQLTEDSWDLENTHVSGLWGAEAFDITGDEKDELFLVYVNDKSIEMQVYEYENGNAVKKWGETTDWGGIFNLRVYQADNCVCWTYTFTRHFPVDYFAYIDGEYKSADAMGEYTQEENDYVYDNLTEGLVQEGELWREVMRKRLGIEDDGVYNENDTLLSLAGEGPLGSADTDRLVERWGITIPEPKLSPAETLGKIKYYGDKSICKMTKEMANAYVAAIDQDRSFAASQSGKVTFVKSVLIDVANDGMPLLITAIVDSDDNFMHYDEKIAFYVWTWNGSKAEKYNFDAEKESTCLFGFYFYPGNSESMIRVGDGIGHAIGQASGNLEYKVANAQITLVKHEMTYSAVVSYSDPEYATGEKLPGVNAQKEDENFYRAKVEDLLDAGWVGFENEGSGYEYLYTKTLNGKHTPYKDTEEYIHYWDSYSRKWNITQGIKLMEPSTGRSGIVGEWTGHIDMSDALKSYAKVAGKPFYTYEDVKSILTDAQLKALAKEAAKKYDGEIGEIYKLSDDLYYIVIYVDDEFAGGVVIKNTKNGSSWKTVTHSDEPMTEEALANKASEDSKISNIKIDYSKTEDGAQYLKQVFQNIDGTVPNDTAKAEISDYVENYISANSEDSIKAKKNQITVTAKSVKDAVRNAAKAKTELDEALQSENVSLNKATGVIIRLVCKNLDLSKPCAIAFDNTAMEALGEANAIMLVLDNSGHGVKVSADTLKTAVQQYTKLTVTIQKTKDGIYDIRFLDAEGNPVDKFESAVTFAVPATDELCTIQAEYTGGTDNWGGQYDSAAGTLSFETGYSGTYTVLEDAADISDIGELSGEHQKAIRFMVSKGYFSLNGDKFDPDSTLTRYTFSEALVRMFFALDRSLTTNLTDVPSDSPYYSYVASGEHSSIIEGYEDRTFRGENAVLREEVMELCSRTLRERKGYVEPEDADSYLHFTDKHLISDWAKSELALAVREGLIDDCGELDPRSEITRADSALMLYRLFMLLYEVESAAVAQSSDTIIMIAFASFAAVLVIIILVLVIILIKRKKKYSSNQ